MLEAVVFPTRATADTGRRTAWGAFRVQYVVITDFEDWGAPAKKSGIEFERHTKTCSGGVVVERC